MEHESAGAGRNGGDKPDAAEDPGGIEPLRAAIEEVSRGEQGAAERLLPLVYDDLRRIATQRLASQPPGQTLQATALVHEAWMRLVRVPGGDWSGRDHFLAAAAQAMRWILVDQARRKRAARHGGGWQRIEVETWSEWNVVGTAPDDQVLALHEALERFGRVDPAKAELVQLRFFGGLTLEEAARVLKVSLPTAKRHWTYARAWLLREIRRAAGEPGPEAGVR